MPAEVPLIVFLTVVIPLFIIGSVIAIAIYFRSREKQMLINQGIPPEQLAELWKRNERSNPYLMVKIGIIIAFFGFALLIGNIISEITGSGDGIPVFFAFMFIGIGFVVASLVGKKMEDRDRERETMKNEANQ
jgi:Na+/glutamate symporter